MILLFLLARFFAMISMAIFILALTPNRVHHKITWCIIYCACIWALFALIGTAACVRTYNCKDRVIISVVIECLSDALEIALALLPSYIMLGLQLDVKRKTIAIASFLTRLL
jgi:hypothetical protein